MKQLTANVLVETGLKGANHGVVTTSDGVVLIDTPHKPSDAVLDGALSMTRTRTPGGVERSATRQRSRAAGRSWVHTATVIDGQVPLNGS